MPYKRLQVKVLIIFQSIISAAHPSLANNRWQKKKRREIQELESRLKTHNLTWHFYRHRQEKSPRDIVLHSLKKDTLSMRSQKFDTWLFLFWRNSVTLSRENQIWDFISRKSRVNDPFMHLRVLICREMFCLSRRSV